MNQHDDYFVPPKTNMTLEKKQPFEDVSPIKHGGFPLPC